MRFEPENGEFKERKPIVLIANIHSNESDPVYLGNKVNEESSAMVAIRQVMRGKNFDRPIVLVADPFPVAIMRKSRYTEENSMVTDPNRVASIKNSPRENIQTRDDKPPVLQKRVAFGVYPGDDITQYFDDLPYPQTYSYRSQQLIDMLESHFSGSIIITLHTEKQPQFKRDEIDPDGKVTYVYNQSKFDNRKIVNRLVNNARGKIRGILEASRSKWASKKFIVGENDPPLEHGGKIVEIRNSVIHYIEPHVDGSIENAMVYFQNGIDTCLTFEASDHFSEQQRGQYFGHLIESTMAFYQKITDFNNEQRQLIQANTIQQS